MRKIQITLIVINLILFVLIIRTLFGVFILHKRTVEILNTPIDTKITTQHFETRSQDEKLMRMISSKNLFGTPPKPKLQAILGPAALIDNEWHIMDEKNAKTGFILLQMTQTSVTIQDGYSTKTLEIFPRKNKNFK